MLILTFHEESAAEIRIPPSTTETVVRVKVTELKRRANKARIGFEAPPEVSILRDEAKVREERVKA